MGVTCTNWHIIYLTKLYYNILQLGTTVSEGILNQQYLQEKDIARMNHKQTKSIIIMHD